MKILYITPHLSTGGCPQFLLKKIQVLHKDHEIYCIEYADHGCFTVQKNKIKEILSDRLISVNYDRSKIVDIIKDLDPDVVHLEEMPEYFMDHAIAHKIYIKDRRYKIIETSHDSSFDPKTKLFFPDKLIYVSKYQKENLKELDVPSEVCEYPILINPRKPREEALRVLGLDPKKKHVVHVGLFTPRKNQKEIIEYAKMLKDHPIQFHFIGNQADNFKGYWEPLMKDFPSNCKWWNERKDVDNFYQAADLFLFVSKDENGDKETSPLVIREAISYNIPTLIYNSPVYMGMYDKHDNIKYLDYDSRKENLTRILKALNLYTEKSMISFNVKYDNTQNKVIFSANTTVDNLLISVKELDSRTVVWAVNYPQLPANAELWIVPTPKHVIDYETDPMFGGLLVEFYQSGTLVYSKSIRIKPAVPNKYQSVLKNDTEPTYMNYMEFFVDKIYDKYLYGKTFNTVVDVGANIGLWTEYIKHTAKCQKVYSVEPNKDALKILKNTFGSDVVVVEKALSNKDGQIEFFVDSNNSTVSSVAKINLADETYKVDCISFKSFIQQYDIKKIDLLKVDIETGEYDLLGSMTDSDLGMIDNILMEYHLMGGRTYDVDVSKILNQLKNAGFYLSIRNMHLSGGFIFATKEVVTTDSRNADLQKMLDTCGCPDKRELATLANTLFPDGKGVEIGVLRGDYSKIILERWHGGQLYLIDAWRHLDSYVDMNGQDDKYHYDCLIQTCENIKPWQNRAHIIRMDSAASANMFPDEHFDFVYIDADHSYEGVVRDMKAWWPKVKKGGLFCGDDYIPDDGDIWLTIQGKEPVYAGKFGVRRAVNEFVAKNDLKVYSTTSEPYWRQWYTFKPF
jgi:glycosyltransferase involved in cell wall biosynthesis